MGSDFCRWWIEYFLTAESVPQEKFCREKMKDCGVTYEVFCANADEFLKQKQWELDLLTKRIAAEKQRFCEEKSKEEE